MAEPQQGQLHRRYGRAEARRARRCETAPDPRQGRPDRQRRPVHGGRLLQQGRRLRRNARCGHVPVRHQLRRKQARHHAPPQTAEPATSNTHANANPQGSMPGAPATTGTNDNLAATGSSSPTTSIALTGGAAVLLGAAAVFVVRRRKTGADA
ncbi:LAETG motif-containing sortase-dependent surface protein [Streptomyces cyaneofuscatus]|uniref:LAETG motif-containing sortase-dependent surface protein n=1 Tax=Streptomyces cyaneofuscatus TaxID=66883 RepID=UPI00363F2F26